MGIFIFSVFYIEIPVNKQLDLDQTVRSVASELCLHCFHVPKTDFQSNIG